jgi:hypothetical protein
VGVEVTFTMVLTIHGHTTPAEQLYLCPTGAGLDGLPKVVVVHGCHAGAVDLGHAVTSTFFSTVAKIKRLHFLQYQG